MYNSTCTNHKSTEIGELWRQGKSLGKIQEDLRIKFTWKNAATGEVVPLADFSRCALSGLFEHDSI